MGVLIGYRWQPRELAESGATAVPPVDFITMRNGGPLWVEKARIVFEGPRGYKSWPSYEWVLVPGQTREYQQDQSWDKSSGVGQQLVVVTVEWLDDEKTHYAQRWEFVRREGSVQGNLEHVAQPSVADGTLPVAESVITVAERRAGKKPPFEILEIPSDR